MDAAVFFTLSPRLRAQLNIENLFDTDYYAYAHSNTNITPGSPLRRASVAHHAVLDGLRASGSRLRAPGASGSKVLGARSPKPEPEPKPGARSQDYGSVSTATLTDRTAGAQGTQVAVLVALSVSHLLNDTIQSLMPACTRC